MEASHPLKVLLQLQLATDSSAVLNLPYTLASLTQDCLLPSSHLPKWTIRINSLLHSKDTGARWSGLCLAHQTSVLSRSVMIDSAQSWLGVALPMLSRNEPLPTMKASIRLLLIIFSAGTGIPEFQRQVATPNVPKFTAALLGLFDKHNDEKLKVLILATLARLVPLYPTLHRASHTALSALSLRFLNGSVPNPTSNALLEAASHLYAVLHFTGGKVGAANLWRKSVDQTLTFGWSAFFALRTTFPGAGENRVFDRNVLSNDEALVYVPLSLDQLRCCTVVLCDLLSSTTQRPVQIPLGSILKFITTLLSCTKDDKGMEHVDPTIQAMEISVVPDFWKFSCDLISCLAGCAYHHLTPNLTRLISYLTFHLEQNPTPSQRLFFLKTIHTLLTNCHTLDSPLIPTRLAKAVLPSLSIILATPADVQTTEDLAAQNKSKKGKKRARGYEGDEVFKISREVICPTAEDKNVLLAALNVMRLLLRNPNLSPALQSISSRVLLSILLALPQMSPTSLSPDPSFHKELLQLVHKINTELGSGTTSVMAKSLGLIVRATISGEEYDEASRDLEILLHPRVPPLVRSLPHVESLSLFRAEEPQEEIEAREELGLHGAFPDQPSTPKDMPIDEDTKMASPKIGSKSFTNGGTSVASNVLPNTAPPPETIAKTAVQHTNPAPLLSLPPRQEVRKALASAVQPPRPSLSVPAVAMLVEEDDEEMPAIDLDSDSDVD